MRIETCIAILPSLQVCCALLSEKSIAGREGINITEVHDCMGDSAAALGDCLEIGIPQQAETRLAKPQLEEV